VLLCFIIALGGWYIVNVGIIPTTGKPLQEDKPIYHMITAEFKTQLADGDITMSIIGVNGNEHPYTIEGTDISGVIKKGEETLINTRFDKPGVYQLICSSHTNHGNHNTPPMIAYIYVY
jgi:plastocyanin